VVPRNNQADTRKQTDRETDKHRERDRQTDRQRQKCTNLNSTDEDNEEWWWTTVVSFCVTLDHVILLTDLRYDRANCRPNHFLKLGQWNCSQVGTLRHLAHTHNNNMQLCIVITVIINQYILQSIIHAAGKETGADIVCD